jgi:hypothetical protein
MTIRRGREDAPFGVDPAGPLLGGLNVAARVRELRIRRVVDRYRRRQGSPATHCRRSRRQRSLGGDRATVAVVMNILGRTAGAISIRYLADWRRRTVMHRDANPTLNSSIAPCRSCTESRGSACGLARHIGPVVVERGLSAGDQRDVGLDVVTVSYQRDGRHRGRPGGLRRGPGHDDGVIAAGAVAVIGLGWRQETRAPRSARALAATEPRRGGNLQRPRDPG